jgi:hypothetical protein
MPRRAAVTIVTRNYAHYARVLVDGIGEHHPELTCFVCVADPHPSVQSLLEGVAQTILPSQLAIDRWHRFSFQYTPFELACALKPYVVDHLIQQGFDEVVYLDGDMQVLAPMDVLFGALKQDAIVITPHLLRPLPDDGQKPNELEFLRAGTYNAGFFAVRSDRVVAEFLGWWKRMCARDCIVDLASGRFVDQRFMTLVPGMFPGVHVLRHAGYNAGHWSLSQFPIGETGSTQTVCQRQLLVGDDPLVVFHYSNMTLEKPTEYLANQSRTSLSSIAPLQSLVSRYHESLTNVGARQFQSLDCQYQRMADGTAIHPAWREAIRRDHKRFRSIDNPFEVRSNAGLLRDFRGIEREAIAWRHDWRLQWPKEQGIAGRIRRVNRKWKQLLRGLKQAG